MVTLTHGEAWYERKLCLNSEKCKFHEVEKVVAIPHRMSRKDAIDYYVPKCRDIFQSLGFKYKDDFEVRFSKVLAQVRKETHFMIRSEVFKIKKILKEERGS